MAEASRRETLSPSPQLRQLPRVTVLMAVYNGAAYLRQAVDSILAQTFRNFEFLIIDDGSTDDSRMILGSYTDPRIRILDNPENIGLTRSLNRGLDEAHGELIARQDADDVSHPNRIEKQVAFLDAHTQIAMVGSQARYIREQGRPRVSRLLWKATTPSSIRFQIQFDNPFFHTAVLYRRKIVWEILGGYNEDFRANQDFELWSRLLAAFEAVNLNEILVDYRWRPNSVSANSSANIRLVEGVFENNFKALVGREHSQKSYSAIWASVTNPKIAGLFSPSEVLQAVGAIYDAFPKQDLRVDALDEIKMLYAAKMLWAARMIAPKARLLAIRAAVRTISLYPKLVIPEVLITLVHILISRPPRKFEQQLQGLSL